FELVLDLVPERGPPEGGLDALGDASPDAVEAQAEGDVVEDAHVEGVGLLKHHADVAPHGHGVDRFAVDVLAPEMYVPLEAEAAGGADEVVNGVEAAEDGALGTGGRADERGDVVFEDGQGRVADGLEMAVVEFFQVAIDDDVTVGRAGGVRLRAGRSGTHERSPGGPCEPSGAGRDTTTHGRFAVQVPLGSRGLRRLPAPHPFWRKRLPP